MLLDDGLKLVHSGVTSVAHLLSELVDYLGIRLSLVPHLVSETFNILFLALELLILLLNHVLQSLNGLISSLRNLLLLLLMDSHCLQSVVLNGILQDCISTEVLISLMPLSELLKLAFFAVMAVSQSLNFFLHSLHLSISLSKHFLGSPIDTS